MVGQSHIAIMLCVREICKEETYDGAYQLLDDVISNIQRIILFRDNQEAGDSTDMIGRIIRGKDDETILTSCSGLVMLLVDENLKAAAENNDMLRRLCSSIVHAAVKALSSGEPDLLEKPNIFWETIRMLIDDRGAAALEECSQTHQYIENSDLEPSMMIIFRTGQDDFKFDTQMECPPLSMLKQLAPILASQVRL